jgi:ABC-type amino acid transport substrate-binding protein
MTPRVVLPAALACVLASVGAAAHAACPPGRATGKRGNTLVVGFSPSPPLVTVGSDERQAHGFAIDLLRTLAVQEGWHLDLIELNPETLRARLAACLLDVGVVGVAVSTKLIALAESEPMLEVSQPYFSTATTAIVHADDPAHSPTAGRSLTGQLARIVVRALAYGLLALAVLAGAAWLLNAFTGFPGRRALRWRRLDAAVNGPWAGLRWLVRSRTGRVLCATWVILGIAAGVTGAISGAPLSLGDDPLRAMVERAAHADVLYAERLPDHAQVRCEAGEERACFRGFADGTMAAIAGPREVLCMHALALSLDRTVVRTDLRIPEQFSYLLPPDSRLRARLDLALLRHHESAHVVDRLVRCPGDSP